MPVEIRELVIKAEVSNSTDQLSAAPQEHLTDAQRAMFIEECVEQMLEMLERRKQK